jgi:hypothetical protein
MSDVTDVTAICVRHHDQKPWDRPTAWGLLRPKFRIGEDLPADWQALIRKHFEIPPAAVIIGFIGYDAVFNARRGLAITDKGLAWVNWAHTLLKALWYPSKGFLDWNALASSTVRYSGSLWQSGSEKEDIIFDQKNRFFDDSNPSQRDVYELVLELQGWARRTALASGSP